MENHLSKAQAFQQWFLANGGYIHPAIQIAHSDKSGYSLRVSDDDESLSEGEKIVACDHSCTLSFANVPTDLVAALPTVGVDVILCFFLLEQYSLGSASFWGPYLRMLPPMNDEDAFSTTLWYNDEDLQWLQSTNLGEATNLRKALHRNDYGSGLRAWTAAGRKGDWTW